MRSQENNHLKSKKMKNLIYTIGILLLCFQAYAQEVPQGFKEQVKADYTSISNEENKEKLEISFEEYYKSREEEYFNKLKYYQNLGKVRSVQNLCDNGTFESGEINTGDWNFYWSGGMNPFSEGFNRVNTGSFNTMVPHSQQVHHQVQSPGPDPYFSALNKVYSFPSGNTKSLRLGNAIPQFGSESISKVITVNSTNSTLSFSYALVMDNPANHPNSLPFFEVNIIDANNPTINYNNLINLGNGSNRLVSDNPLLKPNNVTAQRRWKDWTCVTADLSSLIGKKVIIEFYNRDCTAGAHWSYTYLDNICVDCDGSGGDEGSLELNQGKSDDCGIPGAICVDYVLPEGDNPSLDIELELIQNGVVVTTLSSPTLNSGSTYCFNLNTSNTSGLNTGLNGFDYKIIGNPKLGTFSLTPKIIGNSAAGVEPGTNNDYDIICPGNFDCCQTDLEIWNTMSDPLPVKPIDINGVSATLAEEVFTIHNSATIPITELRISVTDIQFEYNYGQCATCIDNPSLWGGIYSIDNSVGNAPNSVVQNPPFTSQTIPNDVSNGLNNREVIWTNSNGAMLQNGDSFNVSYLLPPASEIPCCVTEVRICIKISWKDANCNVCEGYTCSIINLETRGDK